VANFIKILRSLTAGGRPSGRQYGEPYVNFTDAQFGVINNSNLAQDLLGVPFFSSTATYSAGQPVNYSGSLYVALTSISPGAFNATQWTLVGGTVSTVNLKNGLAYNGAMTVSQELGTTGFTLTNGVSKYVLDGWYATLVHAAGTASFAAKQASSGGAAVVAGLPQAFTLQSNNANFVSLANNDYLAIQTPLEGFRIARLAFGFSSASPVSYGFFAFATVSGTIALRLFNAATNRFYYQERTLVAGWNYVTGTIPGDITGTWEQTTNTGCWFSILVCGKVASPITTLNTWITTSSVATSGQTNNFFNATNNQFFVTGFTLYPGNQSVPQAYVPVVLPHYEQELITCQRYYQTIDITSSRWFGDGNAYVQGFPLRVVMRTTPSIDASGVSISGGARFTGYPNYVTSAWSIETRDALVTGAYPGSGTLSGSINLGSRL
jgi:hypothetical protein